MNIFKRRPLCLVLCIGLCGFFLYSLDNKALQVILPIFAILLFIISMFMRKAQDSCALTRVCSIVILISSLFSQLYFNHYFKAYKIYEGEVEIVGVVRDVSESSSYTTRLLVDAESIDGKTNHGYTFYSYAKKTDAKGVIEGTRISFKAKLDGFSDESKAYNISKGINAYASDVTDLKILEYTDGGIEEYFNKAREYITRYIISKTNQDTGAIVSALLLGERDYLPNQLRLDFRRIGISHILALSGMHLAVLSAGIERLLSFFKVKKKPRVAVTGIFVFIYMAFTGFSISVVRAGLMVIISSFLYLLSRSKDSLTSLSVAVTIICIINPNSIFDISLQLSALATFGIIILSELSCKFKKPTTRSHKILRYISVAFLASLFAISATMAVSTFSFGGFSILAPFATIVFSILAEGIMYLGCIFLFIGWLLPIGIALTPLCFILTELAGALSSIKFAYVSSNFDSVLALTAIYSVVFYLFAIVKLKKPIKALNAIVVLFCIISIIPTVLTICENQKETVAYYSSNKCDEVIIRSENEVCLINSAQYAENLAYTSIDFLESTNVTFLDKYYLTHYSWSIDDEIDLLLSNVSVKEVYIPSPRNNDEKNILKLLYKTVENYRTNIVVFQEYETVTIGNYNINLLYSATSGETSMNAFSVANGNVVYTYISSGLLTSNMKDRLINCISLSDYVIFGEHGKKYKDKVYFEESFEDLDGIIIHGDNIYLKQENMQFYLDGNCDIYAHPNDIIYLKK